jgi:histidinol dehydrogenase
MAPFHGDRMLHTRTPDNVALEMKDPVDPTALDQAKAIMAELRPAGGKVDAEKLLQVAKRLGDIKDDDDSSFVISKEACQAAFEGLTEKERTSLVNIHNRVKAFAEAQRRAVTDMEIDIPGGKAGHTVSPCNGTCPQRLTFSATWQPKRLDSSPTFRPTQ